MVGKKKSAKKKKKPSVITVSDKSNKKKSDKSNRKKKSAKERKNKSKDGGGIPEYVGTKDVLQGICGKEIEAQEYYQGLIAKEDLDGILELAGDFVVRMDCKPGELSKYVLCVLAPKKEYNDMDHKKIVKEYLLVKEGKFVSIGGQLYISIVLLIDDLYNKKIPLPNEDDPKVGEIVLKRGVHRPCWELKHEWVKYEEDDVLGSGQFGKVYKGDLVIVKENQTVRPIKVAVKVATNDEDHKTLGDTLREARAMRNIEHPNVIKFYGIVIERDPVMLVIELVNMGSLISHLQKEPSSEGQKNKFALQAAWGLEYLHQKKVIHRDIAARNCLLHRPKEGEDEITLKIADFGLSRVGEFYQIKGRHTLPIRYLPYESFNNGMFTSMSDCWMFGALLFEIYSDGSELYEGFKLSRVKERIGKHDLQGIPEAWPKEAKTLIDSCWKKEPKERITMKAAAEILERLTKQKTPVVCNPDMMRKRVGKTKKKTQDGATLVTEGSEKSTKAILRRGKVKGEATERTEGSGKSVQMRVKRKAK